MHLTMSIAHPYLGPTIANEQQLTRAGRSLPSNMFPALVAMKAPFAPLGDSFKKDRRQIGKSLFTQWPLVLLILIGHLLLLNFSPT